MKRQKKPRLIVIVGPTASGKSELAVKIAKYFDGEIISADSRQVYKGLDIGTGKVPGKWKQFSQNIPTSKRPLASWIIRKRKVFVYKGVSHHCIDFVPPKRIFTAVEFKKCAEAAIKDIASRGKIPILAGGTGFYIDVVVHDMSLPEVPPNPALRKELEGKSAKLLFNMLKRLDPRRAGAIDPRNPMRLIRAIEIIKALGLVPKIKKSRKYDVLWLGIKIPHRDLCIKIHKRLIERFRVGMIAEAKKLKKAGLPLLRFYQLGLEYRYLGNYLKGKLEKDEMSAKLEAAIRDYARRQFTWFRRNKNINWVSGADQAVVLCRGFLKIKKLR